jgi:hypothetical protein
MKTKNIPYRCQCGEMRADRICERCGASLCEKCSVVIEREEESQFYPGLMVFANHVVCQSCKELV